MAPRKPKPADDDASVTSTGTSDVPIPAVLKPKTEKAKVTKPKPPKKEKVIADAGSEEKPKARAVRKEKVIVEEGEKVKKVDAGAVKAGEKDGKEKVKPVNGEEAIELLGRYLKEQNRPYSVTEISANLHNKVTKTVSDKLLKEMEQNGDIMGKATKKDGGGQWVFWAIQSPEDNATPEQLTAMDAQINTLRENMPSLKANLKALGTKLNTLVSAPTTAELAGLIQSLQRETKNKAKKLQCFKEGTVKTVTREDVEKAEKDFKYWTAKQRGRKAAFRALEGMMLEGDMSKEELWDRAGLEEILF